MAWKPSSIVKCGNCAAIISREDMEWVTGFHSGVCPDCADMLRNRRETELNALE